MSECPREPGYYWAHRIEDKWSIIEIWKESDGSIIAFVTGNIEHVLPHDIEEVFDRFIGPLQPPEEG